MPVNLRGISLTRGRTYDENMAARVNDSLQYLPIKQRAAVLATMMEESGVDPLAKSANGTYQGLVQWGADRYRISSNDKEKELASQLQNLKNTLYNTTDHVSWTHGGEGSGYNSFREAYGDFHNNDLPLPKIYRALSYGYVRPQGKEDSYNNRLKVANQVLDRMIVGEVADAATNAISSFLGNKKDEGGFLDKPKYWNDLSMQEKSEIMKVAVQNGIYSLSDIKQRYNEFAEGGPKYKKSEQAYYDKDTDTVYAPDSLGEFYHHEMFHARPDSAELVRLRPYYDNLNDNRLLELGADLPFVKRIENDPGYFYSPEEVGARVKAARHMLNNAGVKKIDNSFLKEARKNENAYGNNFRDLLHMYNDDNLIGIFGNSHSLGGPLVEAANEYKHGGKIHIKPENRGKFTRLKERTGHSASWFKAHGTPAQKKMAIFELNARHWKHGYGGNLFDGESQSTQQMSQGSWKQRHQAQWYGFLRNKGVSDADAQRLSGFFTAQDGLESAGGTSPAARKKNNYGGMQKGGKNIAYNTVQDYMEDKWKMMNNRFKPALSAKTVDEYATILGNPDTAGKGYLYYVTANAPYDPNSPEWRAAQTQHMNNYINGMRRYAGMKSINFKDNPALYAQLPDKLPEKLPEKPVNSTPLFMPSNPETFFNIQQPAPIVIEEETNPVMDLIYKQQRPSEAELKRAEQQENLRKFNLMMGLLNPQKESDSFFDTMGLLSAMSNKNCYGGHIYDGTTEPTQQMNSWLPKNYNPQATKTPETYTPEGYAPNGKYWLKADSHTLPEVVVTGKDRSRSTLEKIWDTIKDTDVAYIDNPSVMTAAGHTAKLSEMHWPTEAERKLGDNLAVIGFAGATEMAAPVLLSTGNAAMNGVNAAGDALAATAAGQRLTSGLNLAANAIGRSKMWPWIDAGLTSAFGAHGIDKVASGDIHNVGDVVETGLDLLPLSQLARPIISTVSRVGNTIKKTTPQITAENAAKNQVYSIPSDYDYKLQNNDFNISSSKLKQLFEDTPSYDPQKINKNIDKFYNENIVVSEDPIDAFYKSLNMDKRFKFIPSSRFIDYDIYNMSAEEAEKVFGPSGKQLINMLDIAKAHNFEGKYGEMAKQIEGQFDKLFTISKSDPDVALGLERSKRLYSIPEYRQRFNRFGTLGDTFVDDALDRLNNVRLQGIDGHFNGGSSMDAAGSTIVDNLNPRSPLIKVRNTDSSSSLQQVVQHEGGHASHGTEVLQPAWMKRHNESIKPKLKPRYQNIDQLDEKTAKIVTYQNYLDEIVTRSKTTIEYADRIRKPGETLDDALDRVYKRAEKMNTDVPTDTKDLVWYFDKETLLNFWKNFVGGYAAPIGVGLTGYGLSQGNE